MAIARYTSNGDGGGGGGSGKKATWTKPVDRWAQQKYTPYKPPVYTRFVDENRYRVYDPVKWNQQTLNTQQNLANKYGASGSTQNFLVPRTQAEDQAFYGRQYDPNWAQSQQTPQKPPPPPNAYNIPVPGKPLTYVPTVTTWNNQQYSPYYAGQQYYGNPPMTNMPGQYGGSYPGYVPQKWPTVDHWGLIQTISNDYNAAKTILQKQQKSAFGKWFAQPDAFAQRWQGNLTAEQRALNDRYVKNWAWNQREDRRFFTNVGGTNGYSTNPANTPTTPDNSNLYADYGDYGGYGGYGGGGGYSYAQNAPEWWLAMTTWRV